MDPTTDEATLRQWIGRGESRSDTIRAQPAAFMAATLDRAERFSEGDPLPALWHWLYFLDAAPLSATGRDGHAARGGFLPPVGLPRRMWAGSRFAFHAPLRIGEAATRRSVIEDVAVKQGRSGTLCFVTVRHEIEVGGAARLTEWHDLVFREDPAPGAPSPEPPPAPEPVDPVEVVPGETMLFRYSALTFNGHRIHYDVDYCRDMEGYPGLVVHGPLTGTLLAGLAEARMGPLSRFAFTARAPLFAPAPFVIDGSKDRFWARRGDGGLAMEARADAD